MRFWIQTLAFMATSHIAAADRPGNVGCEYAFEAVNVIAIATDGLLPNQTVLVDCSGTIIEIEPTENATVPDGFQRIDGSGQYLMPGLSDMHAHLRVSAEQLAAGTHPELILYLLNGVTTVRDMAGSSESLELRTALRQEDIVGPTLYAASPVLEGDEAVWSFARIVSDGESARAAVREFASDGFDYVKVYHTLSANSYRSVISEARRLGMPVVGHIPFGIGIEAALEMGQTSVAHLRGYDIDGVSKEALERDGGRNPERFGAWLNMSEARMDELVNATVNAGAWNVPTIVVNDLLARAEELPELARHPMSRHMPDYLLARLADPELLAVFSKESRDMLGKARPAQLRFLKRLVDQGGRVLIGTDVFPSLIPGFAVMDEIKAFVDAGLTPYQALRSATLGAAEFVGATDQFGTVEVGKTADLILLSENPLDDVDALWQLSGTMIGGRWYPREALFRLLHAANDSVSSVGE